MALLLSQVGAPPAFSTFFLFTQEQRVIPGPALLARHLGVAPIQTPAAPQLGANLLQDAPRRAYTPLRDTQAAPPALLILPLPLSASRGPWLARPVPEGYQVVAPIPQPAAPTPVGFDLLNLPRVPLRLASGEIVQAIVVPAPPPGGGFYVILVD